MSPDAEDRFDDSTAVTGIARTMEEARRHLTILSARAQLLHRRIQQGRIADPRECLEGLVAIQLAAQELEMVFMEMDQILRNHPDLAMMKHDTQGDRQGS